MKHIKTLFEGEINRDLEQKGCGLCQVSCQSACKTSCTVGNQECVRQN